MDPKWKKMKEGLNPYEKKHPYAFLEQDIKHHKGNLVSHASCLTCQEAIQQRLAMKVITKDGVKKVIGKAAGVGTLMLSLPAKIKR